MTPKKVLITRPLLNSSDATAYTYKWANDIIRYAKSLGYSVIDMKKSSVTYERVSKAIKIQNPDIYIHFGHGCPASLIGQYSCVITNGTKNHSSTLYYLTNYAHRMIMDIECDSSCTYSSNVSLLSNRFTITYSCLSAKRLGICAIKHNAKMYMGFNDYLIFMTDTKKTEQIFKDILLTFTQELLRGSTVKEARDITLQKFDEAIRKYKKYRYLARILLWDMKAFSVYTKNNNDLITIFD